MIIKVIRAFFIKLKVRHLYLSVFIERRDNMSIKVRVNLREMYPKYYNQDCFVEVDQDGCL